MNIETLVNTQVKLSKIWAELDSWMENMQQNNYPNQAADLNVACNALNTVQDILTGLTDFVLQQEED